VGIQLAIDVSYIHLVQEYMSETQPESSTIADFNIDVSEVDHRLSLKIYS